ncbi:GNAT family N-acetyltransferase, partial [Liquorilactobacillus nagelii]
YFLPEARGHGFGKEIMLRSIKLAAQLGYQQLYIETFANLDSAIGLYQHFGFEQLSAPLAGSSHSACDRWFIKKL